MLEWQYRTCASIYSSKQMQRSEQYYTLLLHTVSCFQVPVAMNGVEGLLRISEDIFCKSVTYIFQRELQRQNSDVLFAHNLSQQFCQFTSARMLFPSPQLYNVVNSIGLSRPTEISNVYGFF